MPKNTVLQSIADEYGTPSFLFDADELIERVEEIKSILSDSVNHIRLCYSIKANPFLIPSLIDKVDMLEVCSPGELKICESYKVPPEMIIYSGVHKEEEDIREAVGYGVAVLTAESIRHYELINSVVTESGSKVKMILRLSSKNQFGMSLEDIEHILKVNDDNELIEIDGLHYFAGTQRVKLKHQREELAMLKDIFTMLREKYSLPLQWFEYGPGLSYPYFDGDDLTDTLRPVKELAGDLKEAAGGCLLTIEMGRFIASSCGYYFTKVCDVKRSYDNKWVILDGGINHVNYFGQMMGMKTPVIITFPYNKGNELNNTTVQTETQTLCGSLCTTNDVIVRSYIGNELGIGDVLVFCNIGAYSITEGLNLFLSRDMPVVLIRRDGIITKVRDIFETWKVNS